MYNLISHNVNKILLNLIKLISWYILRTVLQYSVSVQCCSTVLGYSVRVQCYSAVLVYSVTVEC